MDVCIEFMMFAPSDGELQLSQQGRWFERGDPVCVTSAVRRGTLSGNNYTPKNPVTVLKRTRLLFVKGVPTEWQGLPINLAKINGILGRAHSDIVAEASGFTENKHKERRWNFWGDLSNGVKNSLQNNGYDTINFAQLKGALRSKETLQLFTEDDLLS